MKVFRGLGIMALVWGLSPSAAQASGKWSFGLNIDVPGCGYYRPYRPPCYYGPRYIYRPYYPVVVPAPVYVQPAPVVVQQPATVVQPLYQPPTYLAPEPTPLPSTPLPAPTPLHAPTPLAPVSRQGDVNRYLADLSSTEEGTRFQSATQLGRMRVEQAIDPLAATLAGDHSPAVREAAARALGLIGSPRALPALQQASRHDADRDVRKSAEFALEIIESRR
ncbi:MAG: HEAT repeat domain-containing protein [Gemmataceae bacterium]